MSEEDVRDGLRDAVAGEPPLAFDPDGLVATARQMVTRRRALVAAGLTTVAVAVAAVAVPVVLGRTQDTRAAAPPTVTSSSTAATAWPPADVEPADHTADELRLRGTKMRTVLTSRLPEVLPTASTFDVGQFGGEAEGQYYEGQTSVNTHVSFSMEGKQYSLYIAVTAPGAVEDDPKSICAASGADCRHVGVRDGGPLVAKTETIGEATLSTVYHFRATGAQVLVTAYNYDMASQVPPTYLPTVPVSRDQLIALATDPALTL